MSDAVAVAPAPVAADSSRSIQLQLGPIAYRLVWLTLMFVYLFASSYLLLQAGFYVIAGTWTKAAYIAATYQLLPPAGFRLAAFAHGFVWLLFIRLFVHVAVLSIRARRLCLSRAETPIRYESVPPPPPPPPPSVTHTVPLPAIRLLSLSSWQAWFEALKGYTSVRGHGYELGVLLRDVLQITAQSVLAYESSQYTANLAINLWYTLMLLATCFSSTIVRVLRLRSRAKDRFAMLLIDLFVDASWLVAPMLLWEGYLTAYASGESPMFEDAYGAKAVMELRIMFVASYINVLVKLQAPIGVLITTGKIRQLVRRQPPPTTDSGGTKQFSSVIPSESVTTVPSSVVPPKPRLLHHAQRWLSVLLKLWGLVVAVAFCATLRPQGTCEEGCQLVLRPWFATSTCRCAVQTINCHSRGIQGSMAEIGAIFDRIHGGGVATLILMHCPALEIPPSLQSFNDLYSFEIYNSSIVSWPATAALSAQYHRRMGSVYVTRTNLSEVPAGLLASELPSTLQEIGLFISTIGSLPDTLPTLWSHVKTLYVEHAQLTEFPRVLSQMTRLTALSLYNNSLTSVPPDAFTYSSFNYLVFNRNPLTQFPQLLGDTKNLYEIQLQYTALAEWDAVEPLLSAWNTVVYARGSPLCQGKESGTVVLHEWLVIDCGPRHSVYRGVQSLSYYTLEGKTQERMIA